MNGRRIGLRPHVDRGRAGVAAKSRGGRGRPGPSGGSDYPRVEHSAELYLEQASGLCRALGLEGFVDRALATPHVERMLSTERAIVARDPAGFRHAVFDTNYRLPGDGSPTPSPKAGSGRRASRRRLTSANALESAIDVEMNCPRCQKKLVHGRLAEHSIIPKVMVCETCKGTFIGPDDLEAVELQSHSTFFEFRRIPGADEQYKPLTCPACKITMDKVTSERDHKVIMDYCPQCRHTWLDGGEIEAVQTESLLANLVSLFRGPKG